MENIKIIPRPLESTKILCLSRLDKDKGVDVLFNALANVEGNWELIVLGDGSISSYLRNLSYTLGISNKISWLGWQDHPWSKVYEASITVISSPSEGFSLSTAESLVRGIPVVSSRCGGPEDMIIDGFNGWLYNVNDINTLSKILNNIVNKTYKLPHQSVCINSIEKYSKNNVINNIEKILKNYIEKA